MLLHSCSAMKNLSFLLVTGGLERIVVGGCSNVKGLPVARCVCDTSAKSQQGWLLRSMDGGLNLCGCSMDGCLASGKGSTYHS